MRNKNLLKLLIGLALVICLYFNPYKIIMVVGSSMYPTLKSHQLVLAKKIDKIERGDIVVAFNDSREIILKRVAYLPGENYHLPSVDVKDRFRNFNYLCHPLRVTLWHLVRHWH